MLASGAVALILHLGFVARESRCVPGHEPSQNFPAPAHHHQQQEHSDKASTPPVPICCQALTSCSLTVDVARPDTAALWGSTFSRSEEHTSELQSHVNLVCRLLLE